MLTNFMYPDEKKRELVVSIPKSPNSFDLIDITRFVVVFGCSIALFYYDSPLLGYFVLLTSFFCFLLIAVKFFVVAIIKQHISNLKKLKKIYETPVETIDGDNITYMFVAPSEDFVKKIAKTTDRLKKNK